MSSELDEEAHDEQANEIQQGDEDLSVSEILAWASENLSTQAPAVDQPSESLAAHQPVDKNLAVEAHDEKASEIQQGDDDLSQSEILALASENLSTQAPSVDQPFESSAAHQSVDKNLAVEAHDEQENEIQQGDDDLSQSEILAWASENLSTQAPAVDQPSESSAAHQPVDTNLAVEAHVEQKSEKHKCLECGKVCKHSSHLKVHKRNHTLDEPFKCKICNKGFTSTGNRNRHEKSGTCQNKKTPKPKLDKFKCLECGKCFSQSDHLKKHRRCHTSEKPYKCHICNMKFNDKSNRTRHMKNVHKIGNSQLSNERQQLEVQARINESDFRHATMPEQPNPNELSSAGQMNHPNAGLPINNFPFVHVEVATEPTPLEQFQMPEHDPLDSGEADSSWNDPTPSLAQQYYQRTSDTLHENEYFIDRVDYIPTNIVAANEQNYDPFSFLPTVDFGVVDSSHSPLNDQPQAPAPHDEQQFTYSPTRQPSEHFIDDVSNNPTNETALQRFINNFTPSGFDNLDTGVDDSSQLQLNYQTSTETEQTIEQMVNSTSPLWSSNRIQPTQSAQTLVTATQPTHKDESKLKLEKKRTNKEKSDKYKYKCDICGKLFSRLGHLTDHLRTHTSDKPFKCSICDKSFKYSSNRDRHQKDIHKIGQAQRSNDGQQIGNQVNREAEGFRQATENSVLDTIYSANQPTFYLPSNNVYLAVPTEHVNAPAQIPQPSNQSFELSEFVYDSSDPLKCIKCEQRLSTKGNLKAHFLRHYDMKLFKCDYCPESFAQRFTLENHIRTHTGDKPFQCNLCGRYFRQISTRDKHRMSCRKK